ncbi:MAG: putative phosphoribosyl transferase [Candidatus Anoxychlamydiales bacterium]|nr:putative phosphoribosyl transferase [Candidatus Anoxychlamydiales bacterium]
MEKKITITQDSLKLNGSLNLIKSSIGLVIFAHGSGSSRFSPRNILVAKKLQEKNISTLLFDLLTKEEEKIDEITLEHRFNINMLAKRLIEVTSWIEKQKDLKDLKLGYFGASTGSSAALIAAAFEKEKIKAVVSRGGRPDLAMKYLKDVKAATLLIVGGLDIEVIEMNEKAFKELKCTKELKIVEGATHLFEEENKLEEVALIAATWFKKHFKK